MMLSLSLELCLEAHTQCQQCKKDSSSSAGQGQRLV